jgi:hypothetical protein
VKTDKRFSAIRLVVFGFVLTAVATAMLSSHLEKASASSWGPWNTAQNYNGMDFRVRADDCNKGECMWWVEFRNRYNETVAFDFRLTRPGERPSHYSDRVTIQPGNTQAGWNMVAVPPNGEVQVWTANWKFGRAAE